MQRLEQFVKQDPAGPFKLRNPLDAFTTYSTHFVILAARTTENAKAFMNPQVNTETLSAIEKVEQLGDAVPYNVGTSSGDVFLVMDTRRFSQFTVQSMKYEVLINGLSKGHAHSNLATTISMTILDSVGISFINFLQWLMDVKLQTNFDGMIFLIKTIFVGHKEDGSTETVQTVTIPAHLFSLEVNLDFAKGVYTAEFMPNMNFSVFQHSRWLHIGTATSFGTVSSKKLGDVVRAFEEKLNKDSSTFYTNASPLIKSAGKAPVATTGKFGRKVQYLITIPKEWEPLEFFGSWKHNSNGSIERVFQQELARLDGATGAGSPSTTSNPAKDVNVSVNWGSTVTDVLDVIFRQVPGVSEFANAEKVSDPNGVAKFYKHVVSLTSDDETIIVHVDVVAFNVPNVQLQNRQNANSDTAPIINGDLYNTTKDKNGYVRAVPKNYFELDYIFTGKNTQVLNFDMKIQNLVFLLAANVKVSEGEMVAQIVGNQNSPDASKQRPPPELMSLRPYDPLLLPMRSALEASNFKVSEAAGRDPKTQQSINKTLQEYTQNLAAFYAISPIQTMLTIKGNPELMLKVSPPNMPDHVSVFTTTPAGALSAANEGERSKYRQQFEDRVLKLSGGNLSSSGGGVFAVNPQLGNDSYMSSPVFATVNVMGPNVDFRTNALVEGQDFASKILTDNYYVLFKITNIIEQGVFTQEMELWSHNVFGSAKLNEETGRQPGGVAK